LIEQVAVEDVALTKSTAVGLDAREVGRVAGVGELVVDGDIGVFVTR